MEALSELKLVNIRNIMAVLGQTSVALWPFWEKTGQVVSGIAPAILQPSDEVALRNIEDEFAPILHKGGLYSYHFNSVGNNHLRGTDEAQYSFGNGTVDSPFSVGALILPNAINNNVIMAKYTGLAEEWKFFIDSSAKLSLELHDASASATEIATTTSALLIGKPIFVVASYDGGETAPVINLYVNGILSNDGSSVETGAYVAMEDTTTPLLIGASGVTATPVDEFNGRIGMSFITGKALTASEVTNLWHIYEEMFGLTE